VNQVITDGGYDSIVNRTVMLEEQSPQWQLQKLKGSKRAYKMSYNENEELEVIDVDTGKLLSVTWSERAQKYKIVKLQGYNYYRTKQEVANYIAATNIADNLDEHSYNLRASVESTIHEVFHRLCKRDKTRYRGIIKTHWYVLMRVMAVNIGRITRYKSEKELKLALLATRFFISLVNSFVKFIPLHILRGV